VPVEFVELEEAQARDGLRMVVVTGVPSPWGEAAKGLLHTKQIPWVAVRLDQASDAMADWTGQRSGPVAIYDDETPRGGWAEILLLTERLAPKPALLPADAEQRVLAMGLAHEICGEMGLGWCQRNAGVRAGLSGAGGFPKGIAQYLASKYDYRESEAQLYSQRCIDILTTLTRRLREQQDAGSRFYLGDAISAVDIYSATFMAMFGPLPADQCPMPDAMRAAFETVDDATREALDPILFEHRDFVYQNYLELPLTLI
jgi:glutathione S-transferase